METLEFAQQHGIDAVVGSVLVIALIVGIFKAWRLTLMNLLVQWGSIALSLVVAWPLAGYFARMLLNVEFIASLVGGFFGLMGEDALQHIMRTFLLVFIGIMMYALIGSILFAFSKDNEWHLRISPNKNLPNWAGRVLSALFSALNAYTYVYFFLVLLSFPMFSLIQEDSIASRALAANIIASPLVETLQEPFENLNAALTVIEEDLGDIIDGTTVDYYRVADIINSDPQRLEEITASLQLAFPDASTDLIAGFESFVEQDFVTAAEVREFLHSHLSEIQEELDTEE